MTHIFAYLDPASGSLLIQAVVASAAAAVFFLRHQISRGARALRRMVPGSRHDDAPSDRDVH